MGRPALYAVFGIVVVERVPTGEVETEVVAEWGQR